MRSKHILILIGSLAAAGCGGGPKLVPVDGTVTWNGKPVENVDVSFVPDSGNRAQTEGGDQTGPNGNYKAMWRGRSGLAPGRYKVYVKRIDVDRLPTSGDKVDPFMANLARNTAPKPKNTKPPTTLTQISFDREVPESGGPIDLDVKARTL